MTLAMMSEIFAAIADRAKINWLGAIMSILTNTLNTFHNIAFVPIRHSVDFESVLEEASRSTDA